MAPPEKKQKQKETAERECKWTCYSFWFCLTSGSPARRRLLPTTRSNLFKPPVQVTRTVRTTVCNVAGNHQRLTGVESTREETLQWSEVKLDGDCFFIVLLTWPLSHPTIPPPAGTRVNLEEYSTPHQTASWLHPWPRSCRQVLQAGLAGSPFYLYCTVMDGKV